MIKFEKNKVLECINITEIEILKEREKQNNKILYSIQLKEIRNIREMINLYSKNEEHIYLSYTELAMLQ